MSIEYCMKHDRYRDTDIELECPECEEEGEDRTMKTGREYLEEFNSQPLGVMLGYETLEDMIDRVIFEAKEVAFLEAERMGEVNLFARNRADA